MKKHKSRGQLLVLVGAIVSLFSVGCSAPDVAGRNGAIRIALNQTCRVLEIPTGPELSTSPEGLSRLKLAEAAGLVELRHPSWMRSDQMEVVATPKLIGVALNPDSVWTTKDSEQYMGGETGESPDFTARVSVAQTEIADIINEEDYKGPLAAPGESIKLSLGRSRGRRAPPVLRLDPVWCLPIRRSSGSGAS